MDSQDCRGKTDVGQNQMWNSIRKVISRRLINIHSPDDNNGGTVETKN